MSSTPTYADEKGGITEIERVESEGGNQAIIDSYTPEEQKRILRKVDLRLIPVLGFMYCVSLMDRTNLGVAMVAGMGVDLKLTGERYSLVVLLFFITYVALQPPATVVLRKLGPRVFLPSIVIIWGSVMIGFGFVKEWHTLLPLRLILGIFEAGFFPGKLAMLYPSPAYDSNTSQDLHTSSPAGTSDTSSRSVTLSSISLACFHLPSPVFSVTSFLSSLATVFRLLPGWASTSAPPRRTPRSCLTSVLVLLDGDGSSLCRVSSPLLLASSDGTSLSTSQKYVIHFRTSYGTLLTSFAACSQAIQDSEELP
jgi:MFS family permease